MPWWVPLLVVAVVGTAVAYASGIAASAILGSRLASFIGLLEVVFASLFAWLLLGEKLTPLQFVGGALILGGIAAVRMEGSAPSDAADVSGAASLPDAAGAPHDAQPADLTCRPALNPRNSTGRAAKRRAAEQPAASLPQWIITGASTTAVALAARAVRLRGLALARQERDRDERQQHQREADPERRGERVGDERPGRAR